uniref:Uncharacterized protein n=1 Tax=Arundo donax TaxID=35708 RepID=A0A0A8YFZ5_ARUDO
MLLHPPVTSYESKSSPISDLHGNIFIVQSYIITLNNSSKWTNQKFRAIFRIYNDWIYITNTS